MKGKLWCDLKTTEEQIEFLRCGRAWETGIIALAMVEEVIEAFICKQKWEKQELYNKADAWEVLSMKNKNIKELQALEQTLQTRFDVFIAAAQDAVTALSAVRGEIALLVEQHRQKKATQSPYKQECLFDTIDTSTAEVE